MTFSPASTHASHGSPTKAELDRLAPHTRTARGDQRSLADDAIRRRREAIKDRKAESVRAAVAEHALALLLSTGFSDTTVDDIARISGVGRRTFFRYFQTKESVVLWHLERFGEHAARLTLARPETEAPLDAVHRALIEASLFYSRAPERTREILHMVYGTPSLFAQYVVQGERFKIALAEALIERSGAPADDLASLVIARVALEALSAGVRRWMNREGAELTRVIDEAFGALRGGVG